MVQQRLLVNCVFHFWDFLQVTQLKAFSLEFHKNKNQSGNNLAKSQILNPFLKQIAFPSRHRQTKKGLGGLHLEDMVASLKCDYQKPHFRRDRLFLSPTAKLKKLE